MTNEPISNKLFICASSSFLRYRAFIINGIKAIPSLLWQLRAMRDKVLHLCTEWKTPLEPIGAASRILQCSRLDHGL